jgi:HEAT repeat protein
MQRGLWIGGLAALLWLTTAAPAQAHGGSFGPIPPQQKGPRGPGGGSGPPTFVDPGFGGPIVTPGSGGQVTPGRASKRKTPITPSFETSWQLWWSLQRDAWLNPVRSGAGRPVTPDPRGGPAWEARRRLLARRRVVPFLLGLLAPGLSEPDDVVASAALALGKLSEDPAAVDVLFRLVEDESRAPLVRESAALALGLLRRSAPALRLATPVIERVRARLLQVFDAHAGGKTLHVPVRTRAFAMYALGLLGDQPFLEGPLTRDGRLVVKVLWERMGVPYSDRELLIAVLTALGLQPRAGTPDGVQEALRALASRKDALGRRWDVLERAHAVTAVARLGGIGGRALVLRIASDRRRGIVVRLSAMLALAEIAPRMATAERAAAMGVVLRAFGQEQELLAVGLANVALGRTVGADLAAGSTRAFTRDHADEQLLKRAAHAPWYLRGFAALGLALAAREATATDPRVVTFRARARDELLRMLRPEQVASVRAAACVALGLLGDAAQEPELLALVRAPAEDVDVRAHAALACGQLGAPGDARTVLAGLVTATDTPERLRARAALALGLVGAPHVAGPLVAHLGQDESTRRLAAVARALGRLGDLGATDALLVTAGDAQGRPLVRAMALVALGRLLDPEPHGSLGRLTLGACYPARSKALQEIFTIL